MSLNLKSAVFISLLLHIVCFSGVELTFGKRYGLEKNFEFTRIFFLGPILQEAEYYPESIQHADSSAGRLIARNLVNNLKPGSPETHGFVSSSIFFEKPPVLTLIDNKLVFFKPTPSMKAKKEDTSIMFYPPMPYHFLLYFKDRQVVHMEAAFYISPEGKIAGLKRRVSTGNPEVDLLIMRNLAHFLNLYKSNFTLNSRHTVKIDLSP